MLDWMGSCYAALPPTPTHPPTEAWGLEPMEVLWPKPEDTLTLGFRLLEEQCFRGEQQAQRHGN